MRTVGLMQAPCVSLQKVQLSALQILPVSDSSSLWGLTVCSPLFHSFCGQTFHLARHFPCPSTSPLSLLTRFPSFVPITPVPHSSHTKPLSHGAPKTCPLLLNPLTRDCTCLRAPRHRLPAQCLCHTQQALQAHSNI